MAEVDAVADLEPAGGAQLVDGVQSGDAVVDDGGELPEVVVERPLPKGDEERFGVDGGVRGGRSHDGVEEGLSLLVGAWTVSGVRAGSLALCHSASLLHRPGGSDRTEPSAERCRVAH